MTSDATPRSRWLAPLVDYSGGLLKVCDPRGNIKATDLMPTPCNEYGIPEPQRLISQVLGKVTGYLTWGGEWDLHHLAWPREDYRKINRKRGDPENTASHYRAAATLRVVMPRQLHELIHAVTEPPKPPDFEVIQNIATQWLTLSSLHQTVSGNNVKTMEYLSEPIRDEIRWRNFQEKLKPIQDGSELPTDLVVTLSSVEDIVAARKLLRPLARPSHFSLKMRAKAD